QGPVTSAKPDLRAKEGGFASLLEDRQQKSAKEKGQMAAEEGSIHEELRQMRRCFQGLAREFAEVRGKWPQGAAQASSAVQNPENQCPQSGAPPRQALKALGISEGVLDSFAELLGAWGAKDTAEAEDQSPASCLEHLIDAAVSLKNPLEKFWNGQKRISFVGPTGVGKTTTLAKIAANYMLGGGGKVVLATIDNYRIAAVEQLKIYGQIMNVPVEPAKSPDDLQAVFEKHRDAELVLVDTAGRSPHDEMRQQELAAFLSPELQIENHLVLSATTREADLYAVIERFGHLDLHGLVLTKLDECDWLGQIVNVGTRSGHPLSFLTNGQKVPEDLLFPDSRLIANMILNREEVVGKWSTKETGTRQERCVH
ncbi:MAG: DEAD/DEAH box helicase family protein, partial [Desulfosalsimonadaceae bacterium]